MKNINPERNVLDTIGKVVLWTLSILLLLWLAVSLATGQSFQRVYPIGLMFFSSVVLLKRIFYMQ